MYVAYEKCHCVPDRTTSTNATCNRARSPGIQPFHGELSSVLKRIGSAMGLEFMQVFL